MREKFERLISVLIGYKTLFYTRKVPSFNNIFLILDIVPLVKICDILVNIPPNPFRIRHMNIILYDRQLNNE